MQFSKLLRFSLFIILGFISFSVALSAQTPTPTPVQTPTPAPVQTPPPAPPTDSDDVIKVDSRLVVVPVSVTDQAGEPVLGLTIKDFRIAEEGKVQVIENVGNAENVPLEIALLIDVSGSVTPLFEFEKSAAAQFLRTVMKPDDRASIFLIGDKPQIAQTRENSQQAAERLKAIQPSGKFTAFYDSVLQASRYLQQNAPTTSRRVILALTDGEDNWSDMTREAEKATYRDVDVNKLTQDTRNQLAAATDSAHRNAQARIRRALQDADTVFYAVNPAGGSYQLNKISLRAQTGMQSFADDTGGTSFLPKFLPVDTKDELANGSNMRKNTAILEQIFNQLANELRAQYLVQYYSEADYPTNRYVKLEVGLQNPAGRRIRARQGYYVKN